MEHVGSRLLSLTANHSSPYEQAEGLQRYTPPLPGLLAYGYTDLPGQCHGTSLHRLTPNPLTCGRFGETPVPRTIEIEDATPQDPFPYLRSNLMSYEAYRTNQGSPWDCSRIFSQDSGRFHGPAKKRRPRSRPNRARTKCASPIQPELIPRKCRYHDPAQTSLTKYCLLLCFLSPAPCKPAQISLINSNIDPRIRMIAEFLRITSMTGGSAGYPVMLFTRCGREFGSRRG